MPYRVSLSIIRRAALGLATLVLVGCQDEGNALDRRPVSGHVTLDGRPLPRGSIEFLPAGSGTPTMGGAPIEDGSYEIPTEAGHVPGTYRVVISSAPDGPAVAEGEAPSEAKHLPKETIPARYNSRSTLTYEVKRDADNTFEIDMKAR